MKKLIAASALLLVLNIIRPTPISWHQVRDVTYGAAVGTVFAVGVATRVMRRVK